MSRKEKVFEFVAGNKVHRSVNMNGMKKVKSIIDPVLKAVQVKNRIIIDVGCGTGDITRCLAGLGARAIGVDSWDKLALAVKHPKVGGEEYARGYGEALPFQDEYADVILFIASLHHVPMKHMSNAIAESFRVLKPGGTALFVEPAVDCSYNEITCLLEDEKEIRSRAYEAIKKAPCCGFVLRKEESFFLERTLEDFQKLVDYYFFGSPDDKDEMLTRAGAIRDRLCRQAGYDPDSFLFHSECRMNVFVKPIPTSVQEHAYAHN